MASANMPSRNHRRKRCRCNVVCDTHCRELVPQVRRVIRGRQRRATFVLVRVHETSRADGDLTMLSIGCSTARRVDTQDERCREHTERNAEIDSDKLGFTSQGESMVQNKHRYRKDGSWLDARAKESPRRSNPSSAACNWLEQFLNSWNTNQSCTIDTGRVISCAADVVRRGLTVMERRTSPIILPRRR